MAAEFFFKVACAQALKVLYSTCFIQLSGLRQHLVEFCLPTAVYVVIHFSFCAYANVYQREKCVSF